MRRRILVSTLLVVAITGLVLGVPLGFATWRLVEDFTRADLLRSLERVVVTLDEQPGQGADLDNFGPVVPTGGRLVVDSPASGRQSLGVDPGPGAVVESLPYGQGGSATLSEPGDVMRRTQLQAVAVVALLVVISVGTGATIAVLTARRLAVPLQHVAERAARLGAGDFRPAGRRHGIPELDRVADVLDTSAAALAQLLQRERDLVGDVSHQLRSRLTALQLRLDELASHPEEATAAEAEAALEQAERLGEVLDDLLRAAGQARAASAEPVRLGGLLREVLDEWGPLFHTERRELVLRAGPDVLVRATPARLREALGVLVDNALRHGGGTVTVTARSGGPARDELTVVEVGDAGDGVPDVLVPHVFDRGVSGASSTGVGLALARALIEADGGRLELGSARPAVFAVYLRASKADDVVGTARPSGGSVR